MAIKQIKTKRIDFVKTTADGFKDDGYVLWYNDEMNFVGVDKIFIADLATGIKGKGGKRVYPKDGLEFFEALPYEFKGSYFRATSPVDFMLTVDDGKDK